MRILPRLCCLWYCPIKVRVDNIDADDDDIHIVSAVDRDRDDEDNDDDIAGVTVTNA